MTGGAADDDRRAVEDARKRFCHVAGRPDDRRTAPAPGRVNAGYRSRARLHSKWRSLYISISGFEKSIK
jgi:hypothetical protein